ncbi:MAG: hypothetical protein WBK88_09640, partial [Methanothrix sp.]
MKTRSWWRSTSKEGTGEADPVLSGGVDGTGLETGGLSAWAGKGVRPTFCLLAALFLVGVLIHLLPPTAMAAGIADPPSSPACDLSVMVERVP